MNCWPEATGSIGASIRNTAGTRTGHVTIDENFGLRDPICALSVELIGPTSVETCATWPSPDPEPNYNASVFGGTGTTTYTWIENGVVRGTSGYYTLYDHSIGTHSLELQVQRGGESGSEAILVTVSESSSCGFGF